MGVLYVIRHGQASFHADDYDVLSARGVLQAELTGAELRRRAVLGHGPHTPRVVSGSLVRQRDSATHCLRGAGVDARREIDDRLNEFDHVDVLAGYGEPGDGMAQLEKPLRRWIAAGENSLCTRSFPRFCAEIGDAFDELASTVDESESALVFTSGGVIGVLCARLVGLPDAEFLTFARVVVNASITTVLRGRGGLRLLAFNEHSHLARGSEKLHTYR